MTVEKVLFPKKTVITVVSLVLAIASVCHSQPRPEEPRPGVLQASDGEISVARALERASDLDGRTIKVFGYIHMEPNGKQFFVDSQDKDKKLWMPDPPFSLKEDSWSKIVIYTGKLSDSRSTTVPCALASFERIEPFIEKDQKPGFPPAEK